MDSPELKLQDINRLLSAFPPGNWGDPEEAMRSYLLAVEDYPAQDVEAGVTALIKGVAPGVNPNFLPPPAALGAECHRQNHLRATREDRDRKLRPALPPPDIERTPESRECMKAILDAGLARLSEVKAPTDKALDERAKLQWELVNSRFHPDMNPDAMRKRLGFTVGDPEDERDVA